MSASATLRTTIVAALSTRPRTTFALAELAGLDWNDEDPAYHSITAPRGSTRQKIHKAIMRLLLDGFRIVNVNQPGSHRGGMYVMTRQKLCPLLLEIDPEYTPYLRVPLPPIRCGTPGCVTYLARDHILQGGVYCSPCWERRVHAGCLEILGEFGQMEMTT